MSDVRTSLHMKTLVYILSGGRDTDMSDVLILERVCPREKEKELAAYIYSVNYDVSRILAPLGGNTCPNCDIYNRSNDQMRCSQSK